MNAKYWHICAVSSSFFLMMHSSLDIECFETTMSCLLPGVGLISLLSSAFFTDNVAHRIRSLLMIIYVASNCGYELGWWDVNGAAQRRTPQRIRKIVNGFPASCEPSVKKLIPTSRSQVSILMNEEQGKLWKKKVNDGTMFLPGSDGESYLLVPNKPKNKIQQLDDSAAKAQAKAALQKVKKKNKNDEDDSKGKKQKKDSKSTKKESKKAAEKRKPKAKDHDKNNTKDKKAVTQEEKKEEKKNNKEVPKVDKKDQDSTKGKGKPVSTEVEVPKIDKEQAEKPNSEGKEEKKAKTAETTSLDVPKVKSGKRKAPASMVSDEETGSNVETEVSPSESEPSPFFSFFLLPSLFTLHPSPFTSCVRFLDGQKQEAKE